jgi:hypothetical protein
VHRQDWALRKKRIQEIRLAHEAEYNGLFFAQRASKQQYPSNRPECPAEWRRSIDGCVESYDPALDRITELFFEHHHDDFSAKMTRQVR